MTDATVTFDLADALGVDYNYSRTKLWVEFNTENKRVTDADGQVRLGAGVVVPDPDGTGSIEGIPIASGSTNPTSFQVKIHYDAPPKVPGVSERIRGDFGWMTITGDAALADLEAEQYAPPSYRGELIDEMEGLRDAAQSDADRAEAAADLAVDISGIAVPDDLVATLVNDPGSDTAAALSKTLAPVFNVRDSRFGAVGDGVTDDTAAVQAAIDAAIAANGKVFIPERPIGETYRITDELVIAPVDGQSQVYLNIDGGGFHNLLTWDGAGDVMFRTTGWKNSTVSGIKVRVEDGATEGFTVWDIDTSVAAQSESSLTFINCPITLGDSDGQVAFRLGRDSGGIADVSFITWINCPVYGQRDTTTGQIGWAVEGSNTLNNVWISCHGAFLDKMFSNENGGNSCHYFYGCGGGYNNYDFYETSTGTILISGGRFEVGKRFYETTNSTASPTLTVASVEIDNYEPTDGYIIYASRLASIILDNNRVAHLDGTTFDDPMIFLGGTDSGDGGRGKLIIRGGGYISSVDPIHDGGTKWDVYVQGASRLTSFFSGPPLLDRNGAENVKAAFTGDTWTADCRVARVWSGYASDTDPVTIAAPLNPTVGNILVLDITNGQPTDYLPTFTFNAVFADAVGGYSQVGYSRRTLTFIYDGTNWLELSRTAAVSIA